MADGTGRSEGYVQLLIKAGLPFAIATLAALFYVKNSSSVSVQPLDEDDQRKEIVEESRNEVLLFGLVDRINELQMKEDDLEARFERYQSMKEREMMAFELKNMLKLEMAIGDYLEKEVSSIESEVRKMQDLEIYGMDLFQKVNNLKSENEKLKKNVKKYYKKCKEGIRVNGARKSMIRNMEAMIKRSRDEVVNGTHLVKKMVNEIHELEALVNQLRSEKMELLYKLEVAEDALTLKDEECKKIKNELEKLENEFSTEGVQLVQLRWTNAFLRRHLNQKDASESDGERTDQSLLQKDLHYELEKTARECECSTSSPMIQNKSLMKKPVGESHRSTSKVAEAAIKADEGDVKSYGKHFSWDWVDEHVHGYGRKSFSSE